MVFFKSKCSSRFNVIESDTESSAKPYSARHRRFLVQVHCSNVKESFWAKIIYNCQRNSSSSFTMLLCEPQSYLLLDQRIGLIAMVLNEVRSDFSCCDPCGHVTFIFCLTSYHTGRFSPELLSCMDGTERRKSEHAVRLLKHNATIVGVLILVSSKYLHLSQPFSWTFLIAQCIASSIQVVQFFDFSL